VCACVFVVGLWMPISLIVMHGSASYGLLAGGFGVGYLSNAEVSQCWFTDYL